MSAFTKPDVDEAGAAELLLALEDTFDEGATTGTTVDVVAGAET